MNDDFYIIEGISDGDDIKDGEIFYQALRSTDFNPRIRFVRSFFQLEEALIDFSNTNYLYCLLSCHGDSTGLRIGEDTIFNSDLTDICIQIPGRRVFMSSCRGGNLEIARYFIGSGAYSVLGFPVNLSQIKALAIWPTMLIQLEKMNNTVINFREMNKICKLILNIYSIPVIYYSFVRNSSRIKVYSYGIDKKRERQVIEI